MSKISETIALGDRRFEVRPLKLGQLRHLLDALEEMTGKSGGGLIDAAAKVVAAGLQPAHPGLDSDAVLDLDAGIDELNAAVAALLRIAGLHPKEIAPKELNPGEAGPVAGREPVPESSSAPSTAPSPPAAAIPTGRSTG